MTKTSERHDIVSPSMQNLQERSTGETNNSGHQLIASDRINGTKVFRPDGEQIGKIDHFMVNKRSGQVEYAVMSFGGFLGLGEELRPLPWAALEYDTGHEGYVVAAKDDLFRNSPFIKGGTTPE